MTNAAARSMLVMILAVTGLAAGCATPPPAAAPPPSRTPPARESPASPIEPPTTPPADPDLVPQSPPPAPDPRPAESPEPPVYLTVLERFDVRQATTATGDVAPGNRLIVETRNVRRLQIDRSATPLQSRKRIVLHLDGQPFEWLPTSGVMEFERSVNGEWAPVRANKP